jgi:ketosteroid isomerase-like protein
MDVESQIRGLTQDFATSFNTGNYDQAAGLFGADGVLMAPHHEQAYGPKAVERVLRLLGDAGYQDLRAETLRVESSGDMAMELGRYAIAIRQANGTTVADRGKYVKVWRRLGAWRLTADCWSSNLPLGGQ